ncbi:MAG: hypothetical protein RIR10_871 [Planctomycetota bacterium]|jgi:hypothetical protein
MKNLAPLNPTVLAKMSLLVASATIASSAASAAELPFAAIASRVISGQNPVFGGQIGTGERFGRACTGIGDVDGDGVPDIAVGSRSDQDGGTDAGAVYVVLMNRDLTPKAATKIGAASGGLPKGTIEAGDMFGYGVAGIGDLDGDDVPDLAITSPNAEPAGGAVNANRGALYICFLNASGSVREFTQIDNEDGLPLAIGDSCGQGCAHLGDLDGDGLPEIGLGAPGIDDGAMNAGGMFIVSVTPNGALARWTRITQSTSAAMPALGEVDNFGGRGLANVGDLDGDGSIEIAVGCYRDDDGGLDRGAVYLLSVRASGSAFVVDRVAKISSSAGNLLSPLEDEDLFGMTVAPLGDLDGDGVSDLAVGNNKDDIGAVDMGALFLLGLDADGNVAREAVVSQTSEFPGLSLIPGERFGRALANFGDIRGDGSVVLGVGAGAGVNGGRLWLVAVGRERSADFDSDGVIGGADLAALLSAWGTNGPTDLDWSGETSGGDLAAFLAAWR